MLDALLSWWSQHRGSDGTQAAHEQHPGQLQQNQLQAEQQQQQQLSAEQLQLCGGLGGSTCGPGVLGLVQRLVVLHIDKLVAVLCLGIALQV
jgi:hypothetical protein